MPLKKTYDYILVVLLATLAIMSYVSARYEYPAVENRSIPLLTPLLRPTITVDLSFLKNNTNNQPANNSDGGSTIIITPGNQTDNKTDTTILKLVVYQSDPAYGQPTPASPIDWSANGPILPGQSVDTPVLYFRNEGNVPLSMYFQTSDWSLKDYQGNPLPDTYKQYFFLRWNYDFSALQVNEVRPIVITLTVNPDIVDVVAFSFNIAITIMAR